MSRTWLVSQCQESGRARKCHVEVVGALVDWVSLAVEYGSCLSSPSQSAFLLVMMQCFAAKKQPTHHGIELCGRGSLENCGRFAVFYGLFAGICGVWTSLRALDSGSTWYII